MRPYYLQPDRILPFLGREKQQWPTSVKTEFYISFEDALWSLLPRLGYRKGSVLLIPAFYCPDVIANIQNHGFVVRTYPINIDLSFDVEKVIETIQTYRPDIFVDFAPAGVPSGIAEKIMRKLPFHTLIVLDRVHSLIEPTPEFFPLTDRYLLLNSYRKVSPFPGSLAVFSRNARPERAKRNTGYLAKGIWLWIRYLTTLRLAKILGISSLASKTAESRLTAHDNLIGDAEYSPRLHHVFEIFTSHIPVAKIKKRKQVQAQRYTTELAAFFNGYNEKLWQMEGVEDFYKELRGFPLIIAEPYAAKFLEESRKLGLVIYAQLDDCSWSADKKLILLPLGPQISETEQQNISAIAKKALTQALQYDTIAA